MSSLSQGGLDEESKLVVRLYVVAEFPKASVWISDFALLRARFSRIQLVPPEILLARSWHNAFRRAW